MVGPYFLIRQQKPKQLQADLAEAMINWNNLNRGQFFYLI